MAITACPAGQWTTLADLASATQLFAPGRGVYYSTDAVPPAGTYAGTIPLPGSANVVIASGLPIHIWPAAGSGFPGDSVNVIHQRV